MPVVVTNASPNTSGPSVFTVISGTFPFAEGPAFRVFAIDGMAAETDMGLHTTFDEGTIAVIYDSLLPDVYTLRVQEDANPGNNDTYSPFTVTLSDTVDSVLPDSLPPGGGEIVVHGSFTGSAYYARLEPGGIELSNGDPVEPIDDELTFTVPADAPEGSYTVVVFVLVLDEPIDLDVPLAFTIGEEDAVGGGACAVEQAVIIRDSQIVGAVVSADSQDGARIGLTVPDGGNQGSLSPVVGGDPDSNTLEEIEIQIVGGGAIGSAEWVWQDEVSGTWAGAHAESYAWGHHAPIPTNRLGAVVVYSSAYRKVIVIAANHSGGDPTGVISVYRQDVNARPVAAWSDVSTLTPSGGVSEGGHALAACETRDGAILLLVKKPVLGSDANAFSAGDLDLYRSEDGGSTWMLARRDILQYAGASGASVDGCGRLAASGNWIRFSYVEVVSGSIATVASADGGATWTIVAALVAGADIASPLSDQDHDIRPFDLVAVDDDTGAFLLTTDPNASGPTNKIKVWYATRDSAWEGTTIASAENVPDTARGYLMWRDPYWLWLWVLSFDNGSTDGRWTGFRAPRDLVLEPTEWIAMSDPNKLRGATRLVPIQARAAWCGDRAAVVGYLEDIAAASPPVGRKEARPWLCWVGGWSSAPWGTDIDRADGLMESLHWDYAQGEPALGGTSATMSQWTHTLVGAGTHSWEGTHVLYVATTTNERAISTILIDPDEQNSPPQWDPDPDDEAGYLASRIFACEWVCAAGSTASSLNANAGVRFWMPVVGGTGSHYRVSVRVGSTNAVVYDDIGDVPVAALPCVPNTLASDIWHRFRFVVSPAATTSGPPSGLLQHRREDGDLWTSVAFDVPDPGSAAVTMAQFDHGMIGRGSSPAGYAEVGFREFRVSSYFWRPDYAASGYTVPDDLPGARAALRPRGITAGSTTSDPGRLSVRWGGAGGFVGDAWNHAVGYEYAAEMIAVDSPRFRWQSEAGATAGTGIVYDACHGGADDGRRFAHSHSAIFGVSGSGGVIRYADDAAITSNVVAVTFNTIQHESVRISAVAGSVLKIDPASLSTDPWREGELAGRLLLVTAGASSAGHAHLIDRHYYDGTNHHVALATGGQFAPALIPAGATVSIASTSAWVDYGQTITRRYAEISFGVAGQNNWSGSWTCGSWVPGIARHFNPPLAWSHTDMEEPNTVVNRARSGQTWAFEEGPPERVWVGRQIGDIRADRTAWRDLLRVLARYQEEPIALILNENSTEDQNRHLLLTRWESGTHLDQQAWHHETATSTSRGAGDQDVSFREIV